MSITSKELINTSNKSSSRKIVKVGIRSNSKSFDKGVASAILPSPKYISANNYGRKTIGVPMKKQF
jgi:hypothetical protein